MRYAHQWVNHTKNFVDPVTGACTNRIEGIWEVKVKACMKSERGMKKVKVPSFLDECLWRTWYFDQAKKTKTSEFFHELVIDIKRKCPV
ncbi:hypothetical protein DVH05_021872 [Phytophthora capsici]|nr:hypothetical protein DVH05_021872 [Phytophthora capsici]